MRLNILSRLNIPSSLNLANGNPLSLAEDQQWFSSGSAVVQQWFSSGS
ncbi:MULTISPECIES: hypothetical protein [Paenibacillus]|nr:hypothetical protein [Paenibacillus odorifer]